MSRHHVKTGKYCICCDESTSKGITLHKTRRQTHRLCSVCAEGYLGPRITQTLNNIKQKIWTNTCDIECPGTYHGVHRNQCKCRVNIQNLQFNYDSPLITDILRLMEVTSDKNLILCPTRDCPNIIRIHPDDPITHTYCDKCRASWCRNCMSQPYHDGMTCLEYEAKQSTTENGKLVSKMLSDGTLKLCPRCKAPTTKIKDAQGNYVGCNKIVCSSCNTKWCWLCGDTDISYNHFNSQGQGSCANKLWEGTRHQTN